MNPPQVIPVTGFFNLVLGFNTGVSFGLFGQAPAWLLMAFTLAIVAGLLVWIHRSDSRLTASALGLVVGGALGNLLDRLRQGAVTDFLDFYIGSYHWPAFNLADVAIVCGEGFCSWRAFWHEAKQKLEMHKQTFSPAIQNYRRKFPNTRDNPTLLRRRCRRFHGDRASLISAGRARGLGALPDHLGVVAHELRRIGHAAPA